MYIYSLLNNPGMILILVGLILTETILDHTDKIGIMFYQVGFLDHFFLFITFYSESSMTLAFEVHTDWSEWSLK